MKFVTLVIAALFLLTSAPAFSAVCMEDVKGSLTDSCCDEGSGKEKAVHNCACCTLQPQTIMPFDGQVVFSTPVNDLFQASETWLITRALAPLLEPPIA